jgi:3-oxoacyl-[acyl-carrier-protein] synthase II
MSWDITGLGAVASIGSGPDEIFAALCEGQDGLGTLRAFDLSRYRAHQAYEIDDRAKPGRDEPFRATRWLRAAISQALRDAALDGDPSQYTMMVGTTLREQRSVELWWREGVPLDSADLYFGPALRAQFGTSQTYTFANACAATLYTLGMAGDLIELDLADTVVVAGTDAIAESAFGTLDRVQNDIPDALRPFDNGRRGMVMGEGAVAIVLQRRGIGFVPARARVSAVSMNCDASHPTAPTQLTISWAIRDAHRRAGLGPADIDVVMLHGSGTRLNDVAEATALAGVFADTEVAPLMTAIKSMTGHTLGGSGLLSLVMAVLSLQHGVVPPIAGLTDPISEADGFQLVRDRPAHADLRTAQVNAFGFGGINAVAILERAS